MGTIRAFVIYTLMLIAAATDSKTLQDLLDRFIWAKGD